LDTDTDLIGHRQVVREGR
jgi:hypothetical protein